MPFYILFVWLVVLPLSGCSLKLPGPTPEGDRDLTGKFDGKWALESNTRIGNCKDNFKRAYMDVTNGVGKIGPNGPSGTGYVSTTGDFRIDVPDNYRKTRRKYGGNLDESTGRVIIVFAADRVSDCSIGLSVNRVN